MIDFLVKTLEKTNSFLEFMALGVLMALLLAIWLSVLIGGIYGAFAGADVMSWLSVMAFKLLIAVSASVIIYGACWINIHR